MATKTNSDGMMIARIIVFVGTAAVVGAGDPMQLAIAQSYVGAHHHLIADSSWRSRRTTVPLGHCQKVLACSEINPLPLLGM